MTPGLSYCANAIWAPRDQPPADIAKRWLEMVHRLQAIDPVFTQWFTMCENDDARPLPLNPAAATEAIAAGVGRDDEGNEEPL